MSDYLTDLAMGYVWEPTFTRNGAGSADIHSAQISYSKLVAGQTRYDATKMAFLNLSAPTS